MPRLDVLIADRGLAESRARAQALIMAGRVTVEGSVVTKAGTAVAPDADVLVAQPPRYVSRGGDKLETALRAFAIDPTGRRCLDVGASTGGFSDCLLQHGAASIVAIDVGRAQLHQRIAIDPRVTAIEGLNARRLAPGDLPGEPAELAVLDVSFISLTLVLSPVIALLAPEWEIAALVKPQFEAGRELVARGVVRDPEVQIATCLRVAAAASALGGKVVACCDSQHPGPSGNREFFLHVRSAGSAPDRIEEVIRRAVEPDAGADHAS